ncbi:MAG: hypothetical protein IT430_19035 [Phycisphaerales bacterium]|nr:hypothetical protein [Phycisphaerales bacterium]
MFHTSLRRLFVFGLLVFCLGLVPNVVAQPVEQGGKSREAELLEDFIHYTLVARPDLAHSAAQALIESSVTDAELYQLVDEMGIGKRLDDALVRAARNAELEEIAGQLQGRLNKGRIDMARDPEEIARHIKNLVGTSRGRLMAEQALRAAGEYAVPQLLDVITGASPAELKARCTPVLVSIGRQAVTPLCVALPHLDPVSQERICEILGQINYYHALPALVTLGDSGKATPAVRAAARAAAARLGAVADADPVDAWLSLAELYWGESQSLVAWPTEATNNIWYYDNNSGLYAVPVPTEIFSEVMVMRSSENALEQSADSLDGLSMWIAGNFRRTDELGDGTDPTYGPDRRPPLFYAVAAGPAASQMVLDRANRDLNARLARHAIEALNGTAGGASLWVGNNRPSPLIESLNFPERRVQYDAALALGRALPTETFDGADRVVPILAGAIRTGDERFAAVLADNQEDQRSLASNLRDMGFTVLPPRSTFEGLRADLAAAPAVDLFLLMISPDRLTETIASIQSDDRISATPVAALVAAEDLPRVRNAYEGNRRVSVIRLGLQQSQMDAALQALIGRTTGDLITREEADAYADESLHVLRDIAVRNSAAYDIKRAETALVEAISTYSGELRLTAAQTLAWVNGSRAQSALLTAALGETDEAVQIALLNYAAQSAKRYGSYASDAQITSLVNLVKTARGPVATAAAQAHGALNLPARNMVPLIISD